MLNKHKRLATTIVAVIGLFVMASPALAGTSSAKDCSVCSFKPAIATTSTDNTSTTTSKTHIRVVKTLRAQIQQYEKVTHHIVTIDQQPGGVKSLAGCVDPVQKGWIQNGGQFSNTRYKGGAGRFWDRWQAGRSICNPHRIKWNGGYYMEGTKDNCGNEKIRIQVSGPRTIHKIIPVVRFLTVKSFRSTYDKWVTKTTTTTSKGGTTTSYSCDSYGSGWTLSTDSNGNPVCKNCPPTPCPTPTDFTSKGSTSVQAQKNLSQPCPAPNQGIVKSGTSDLIVLNSPTFTGHGSSQSAADQDLANQESSWRSSNQSVVDSQALSQAQSRLNTALQSCPSAPPPHFTQLSCTWQEEITGGGSSLVVCDVQDDNGAPIALFAQSQDSNSQVSGINCYSQGGSSSCNGNGTFQFRVDGFNNTSNVVTTTIKVYAMANGVQSNPVTITINVDPANSNF